jgi:hypothetical protein
MQAKWRRSVHMRHVRALNILAGACRHMNAVLGAREHALPRGASAETSAETSRASRAAGSQGALVGPRARRMRCSSRTLLALLALLALF